MFKRIALATLSAILLASAVPAADTVEVELLDGRTLNGVLRPVTHGLYLLQAEDVLYELDGREIGAVDGEPGPPVLADAEPLAYVSTYRHVLPNGDVEIWSSQSHENNSDKLLTWIKWGAAEHELDAYRSMVAYDRYGNRLDHRIEPRAGTDIHDVIVDFRVAAGPEAAPPRGRRVAVGLAAGSGHRARRRTADLLAPLLSRGGRAAAKRDLPAGRVRFGLGDLLSRACARIRATSASRPRPEPGARAS